jgi:hypothetical protein
MQQFEFALSVIPTGCFSAVIVKLPCHAAVFKTFLRKLTIPEVDRWAQIIFNPIFPFKAGIIYFSNL